MQLACDALVRIHSKANFRTNHFVSVNGEEVLKIGFEGFFVCGAMSQMQYN